jgi:hypothetical protein
VQGGKNWEEEGALSSLVENSGHTSERWLGITVVLKVVSCGLNLLTVSSRGHVGSAS